MNYSLERREDAAVTIVRLSGEIDIGVTPEVREALGGALEGGCSNFVVDLERVTYLDSSGLGLIVWLDHQVSPEGGRIALAAANRDISRILELSGLVSVAPSLSTSATVDAALEGFELPATPSEVRWIEELTLPANVEALATMRSEVIRLISGLPLSDAAVFDVKVAVGEALANAVRYGSPQGTRAQVGVRISAYDDRIAVAVTDSGCSYFDGECGAADDLYAPRGRGIMFMRALMDRVEFEPSAEGGTTVTLVKHLKPRSA
ncbi:MAG: hypothetical protein C0418_00785 [Coriobacteriaceae bacterium]|nr:hypothetical protein [Coriobacteriaceae bacterium]